MEIKNKTTLKKWGYCQTNLIEDESGNRYIEKFEFYDPSANRFCSFPYHSNECEVYSSILSPLGISHVEIIENTSNSDANIFIMEYVSGIVCEEAPLAIHLYKAAEKAGEIYNKSTGNMSLADKNITLKYTLNKEKIYSHIEAASSFFDMEEVYSVIDYIFERYKGRPLFVNHFDMHLKNFIYNDDLVLIDWATMQISPFYTDLYVLLTQAKDVGASVDEIKARYKNHSQIEVLDDEDIHIGGIIWSIVNIHWLLELIGSDDVPFCEWAEELYNDLKRLIQLLNMR
jgi:Phosphotransferase enzyme family.